MNHERRAMDHGSSSRSSDVQVLCRRLLSGGWPYVGWLIWLDQTLTTTPEAQGLWGEPESQGGGMVLIIRPTLARLAGRTTSWYAI